VGPRREHSRLPSALLAGGAVAAFAIALQALGVWRPIELKAYDLRMKATLPSGQGPVRPDIVILNISDESIEWMKERRKIGWPWHRGQFAALFRALSLEDFPATAVLFDFLTLVDLDPYGGEPELVAALRSPVPVFAATPFREDEVRRADRRADLGPLLERYEINVDSDGSVAPVERNKSVLFPMPGVAEALAGVCDVVTPEDSDGITRRYRILTRFRGKYYPSFVLAALMAREKTRRVEVRDRVVRVGSVSIPVERDGTIGLRYYRSGNSFKLLTAPDVLAGLESLEAKGQVTTFDPSLVADRFVFVGTDAAALFDLKVTSVAEALPGVEIHATALANVLEGTLMRTAPAWSAYLAIALGALLTALATRLTGPAAGGAAAAALFLGTGSINVALFQARWAVPLVAPLAAVALSYAVTSAANYLTEGRQRQRVKREFQRYLSPRVVEKILKTADALRLEGERKELTVFFLDFAGFTAMSETLDPAELVKLISEYHHQAAEEIFRTEGTIDKYIGDALMAFWNDPIAQPDHALRACLAAIGAQNRLRAFAARMRERGLPEIRARVGINTGIATVGNMGARGQVNYTVIGDEVNLASRLEGVNKEFGTGIIVSEATWLPAKERLEARELALIKVKGKKHPVRIFELIGARGEAPAGRLEAARRFEEGLSALRARRFGPALEVFEPLEAAKDAPSAVYAELCREYLRTPPPADWDGAYQMQTK
jgi:adenylate cyclase